MSWIAARKVILRSILTLILAGAIGCGDTESNPSTSTSESFPEVTDIEDGSVSLVSGEFFVDHENRFYSNLARLRWG